jgi:hypothetical protein
MKINVLREVFTVCKIENISKVDLKDEYYFLSKADEELSLVCTAKNVPDNTLDREDGWRGFRIQGVLDFSLIGILSKISSILAENEISIFAVSTYQTDYIFIQERNFEKALKVLENNGYEIVM